jgi:hypothetical protein
LFYLVVFNFLGSEDISRPGSAASAPNSECLPSAQSSIRISSVQTASTAVPGTTAELSSGSGMDTNGRQQQQEQADQQFINSPRRTQRNRSFHTIDGYEIEIEGGRDVIGTCSATPAKPVSASQDSKGQHTCYLYLECVRK